MGLSCRGEDPVRQSVASSDINYDQLRDQLKQNNALKGKVDFLREQASINMKMALMKVPEKWRTSLDPKNSNYQSNTIEDKMYHTDRNVIRGSVKSFSGAAVTQQTASNWKTVGITGGTSS
mmetsp:Transcript_30978/g.41085  ORF Transcript_30978/g.41085 Transcript_30978/m.41085 type:complete len:121 (+) Transcript_30978:1505-1867(+)